jgi:hypothetical protein
LLLGQAAQFVFGRQLPSLPALGAGVEAVDVGDGEAVPSQGLVVLELFAEPDLAFKAPLIADGPLELRRHDDEVGPAHRTRHSHVHAYLAFPEVSPR